MAQPTPYTRQYNFNDFATTSPSDPLPESTSTSANPYEGLLLDGEAARREADKAMSNSFLMILIKKIEIVKLNKSTINGFIFF